MIGPKNKIVSFILVVLIILTSTNLLSSTAPVYAAEQNIEMDLGNSLGFSGYMDTKHVDVSKKSKSNNGICLGQSIFKDVFFYVNGEEVIDDITIEYEDGMRLELRYDWEIPDEVGLENGDWAKIKVPSIFKGLGNLGGKLEFDEEEVGEYSFDEDNYLTLVFNDKLKDKEERNGSVGFVVDINLKEFEDDSFQRVDFGENIEKTLNIGIKPSGDNYVIAKNAKDLENDENYIDWIIDVNTTLDLIEDMIIHDILSPGLSLDGSSLKVTELIVGLNGNTAEGAIEMDYDFAVLDDGFSLNMGKNNKAYRISYRTIITDKSLLEYKNTAALLDKGDVKNTTEAVVNMIPKGSYIEKTGAANEEMNATTITWTIDVNKAQDNLENVTINDLLPKGLSLSSVNAMKIYSLNRDNNDWVVGDELPLGSSDSFPLDLGDIKGDSYRIVFDTDIDQEIFIDDEGKLISSIDFTNNAELVADSDKGEPTIVDTANSTVTVVRDRLVSKSGKEVTSYDHKKPVMEWTVEINKAKQNIYNATLKDTIGQGHHILADTVKVYDEFDNLVDKKVVMNADGNGFNIDFGHIDSTYKIVYRTEIDNITQTEYKNKAQLLGWLKPTPPTGGPGSGDPGSGDHKPILEEFEGTGTHSVQNKYEKYNVWETIQGVDYHGVDYSQQTMSWKITVDAIKEEIAQLKIEDSFLPEKSMTFLSDSLVVTKDGEVITTGYTVTDLGVNGFEFEFTGTIDRAKYEIYYKTSFTPGTVLGASGALNPSAEYLNEAKFTGSTAGSNDNIDITSKASYQIKSEIFNSGSKSGYLNRENREVAWDVLLNLQNRDLTGKPYVVTDKLSDGQEFVEESFIVNRVSVSKDGSTQLKDKIESTNYKLTYEKDSFKLVFDEGLDYPISVRYNSSIKGISQESYKNTAATEGKDGNRTYNASVRYPKHSEFVKKELSNQQGNLVFMDDELNWKVTINESLSEINNAEFVDKISAGHEYVRGSLKVYKNNIFPENEVFISEDVEKIDGATLLKLKMGDINSKYILTYDTVVVADSGKISNTAKLSGDKLDGAPSITKEFEAKKSSWGMGSGKNKGSLKLVKRDSENSNITLQGAGFELWYLLNGEERQVSYSGKTVFYTDESGTITFSNLSNNRQYIIKEVTAPEGYKITENDFLFIAKTGEVGLLDIPNEKDYGSLEVTKVDTRNSALLSGAKFGLYHEDGTLVSEKTTDKTGIVKFEGLEYGSYTLKELEAPKGYNLSDEEFVFSIDAQKSVHAIQVENEPTNDPKPVDPVDPKPVDPVDPKPVDPDKPVVEKPSKPERPHSNEGTTIADKTPEHSRKIVEWRKEESSSHKSEGTPEKNRNDNPDTGGPQNSEEYLQERQIQIKTGFASVAIVILLILLLFLIALKLRSE